ncbi:rRNA (cytosine-N4-)-methyltransferase [Aureococcus anophagefferens]|nr:rRNA (cytosine-N4-)-methyltransferase [Aureococcus anophagefferens]
MVAECLEHLRVGDAAVAVDCTLGYGGHSTALVAALPSGARLLGVDRDGEELAKTAARLAAPRAASGEVDDPERGFTYKREGPST